MFTRFGKLFLCTALATSLCRCSGGANGVPVTNNANDSQAPVTGAALTRASVPAGVSNGKVAIDAGGAAAPGKWSADKDYGVGVWSGVDAVTSAIDTSRVSDPAPQAVYRSQRYSRHLTYTIPNLRPGAAYVVRLHCVESFWQGPRKRIFDITLGGVRVLSGFDIFAAAGGAGIAIVEQFATSASAAGTLIVALDASVDRATVAGIEVIPVSASPVPTASASAPPTATPKPSVTPIPKPSATPTPKPSATPTSVPGEYADGNLPPPGWQFPYAPNPFTLPACAADPCSPPLDPDSATQINAMMLGGALDIGDIFEGYSGDNDFPVYYASATDPAYTVRCDIGGCGAGTVGVRIPNGATVSAGADHHLAVVNVASGVETDFWEFNDGGTGTGSAKPVSGGGALVSGSAGVCTSGAFASGQNICANSATGSKLPIQPQLLDPRELLSGTIAHTLYIAIGCGRPAFTYPAGHSDGTCAAGPSYGERIWLDLSDARINALPDAPWAKTMLRAMHHYGWTVSDSNGGGAGVGFAVMAPQTFTLWKQPDPWPVFFALAGGGNHAVVPTAGISQANVHVLAPCLNDRTC